MTKLLFIAVAHLVTFSYAREFTDKQGRKLDAELMSVDGANVSLKRNADGKVFTVHSATFSEADQAVIREFAATNVSYSFEMKNSRERISKVKRKMGNVEVEDESWDYKIDLRNLSRGPADGVKIDYCLFKRSDEGGKTKLSPRRACNGTVIGVTIAKGGGHQFTTDPIVLTKTQLDADRYYTNGTKNKTADSLGGLVVKIFKEERLLFEFATDPDLAAAAVTSAATPGN